MRLVSRQIRRYQHCVDRTFEIEKKFNQWIYSPFDTLVVDGLPMDKVNDTLHLVLFANGNLLELPRLAYEALSRSD